MRTPGRTTSKKLIWPESQKAYRHWHAPTINYPKQKRFCETKEDFHEEYGLSLEGKNPRHLSDADVPENQWLTVFTQKRVNNEKILLKSLRPEFYEECALLYHMIYQRDPPNNEISVKFARGFAFERCRLAQSPTKKVKHKVAWALFAESVIKNVTLRKNLQTKIALWRAKNSQVDDSTISASHIKQDSLETSLGGDPSLLGQPCSQYDKAYCIEPASLVHVDMVADMVNAAKQKLDEKESLVVNCRASIDEAKTRRDKAKGVRSAVDALLEKINRAKEELQALEGEGDEASIWLLKAEVMGCQAALDLLGPDVHSSTLDKAVDDLQDLYNHLLKEVEEANAQSCFVNDLAKQMEKRQAPSLALVPPVARQSARETLVTQDECVACGLSLEDGEVVGVYMLPCRHPYHPICFAAVCHTREGCVQIGCSQSVPHSARQMLHGCRGKLSEQSILPVEASRETEVVVNPVKTPSKKHGYNIREIPQIRSSHTPVLQAGSLSIVGIAKDGTGLISISDKGEGDTLNSHGGDARGEDPKSENGNVAVKEHLCTANECHPAGLSVAVAMAKANGKENVLGHADGGHDAFQHSSLANMGAKRRKGIWKEKAFKKCKKMMPLRNTTT